MIVRRSGPGTLVSSAVSVLLLGLFAFGCAYIAGGGPKQNLSVNSSPEAAEVTVVTVGGVPIGVGTTPASFLLPRGKEYIVTISMEGYRETQVTVTKSLNEWVIGNILCGGVIGLVVDFASGAAYKLEPEMINVQLVTASLEEGDPVLYAFFQGSDEQGQLRSLAVPMIRSEGVVAR